MIYCGIHESIIGSSALAADDESLLWLMFNCNRDDIFDERIIIQDTSLLSRAFRQLDEYFAGRRKVFTLPLKLNGTKFQLSIWETMQKIPYGQTISYGELAEQTGHRKAAHAAGGAVKMNHLPIFIPCHRVIASGGKIGGYSSGLDIKRKLLAVEGIYI